MVRRVTKPRLALPSAYRFRSSIGTRIYIVAALDREGDAVHGSDRAIVLAQVGDQLGVLGLQ